jgi:hypothetical protein
LIQNSRTGQIREEALPKASGRFFKKKAPQKIFDSTGAMVMGRLKPSVKEIFCGAFF